MPALVATHDVVLKLTAVSVFAPQNFALVEEQVVHFAPGLNVITGASGSGKSVLVRAAGPGDAAVHQPAVVSELELTLVCRHVAACVSQMDAIAQLCGAPMLDEHVRPPADSATLEVCALLTVCHTGSSHTWHAPPGGVLHRSGARRRR